MSLRLPQDKLSRVIESCKIMLQQDHQSLRDQGIGYADCYPTSSLACSSLLSPPSTPVGSVAQTVSFVRHTGGIEYRCETRPGVVDQNLSSWNGRNIKAPPLNTIMETDASMIGWGATCMGTRTGGLWSPQEQQRHINSLELQAGEFAVSGCLPSCLHMRQQSGCPSADRRVFACPFINDLSKADEASLSVVAVLSPRGITLSAEYLPGVQNIVADEESRSPQRSGNSSPMCSENSGPLFSGLVSHSIQPPVAQVCELEARSICHGNGCLQPRPPRLHDLL